MKRTKFDEWFVLFDEMPIFQTLDLPYLSPEITTNEESHSGANEFVYDLNHILPYFYPKEDLCFKVQW